MERITFALDFPKGYIAHPYWPAQEKLINIIKESGLARARSSERRAKALEGYLKANGLTVADYERLKAEASRPFYTAADEGFDGDEIVIPERHIFGMLACAADEAPRAMRAVPRPQIRTAIAVLDLCRTGKFGPDGVWERFVVVTGGFGGKISNQRALRSNPYLGPFTAELHLGHDPELVSRERLAAFIEWAGENVGIGASRKMGWGRFSASVV